MDKQPEIKQIRIKKVSNLSPKAQEEVQSKLEKKGPEFRYHGYARVNYIENSPLKVHSVDPLEGTILEIYKSIMSKIEEKED